VCEKAERLHADALERVRIAIASNYRQRMAEQLQKKVE